MRVLLITQYFHPERTAAPLRLRPFAAGLVEGGHEVEVICEIPNHPEGIVHQGFRGRSSLRRSVDGAAVHYVWVPAHPSKTTARRLLSYGSYALAAAIAGAVSRRPDVILASSPPLSVGSVAALLARRFSVPWVFDIRDLWPEAAADVAAVRSSRLLAAAARLEQRLYRSASAITVPTEAFGAHIGAQVGPDKVTVVANGTSPGMLELAGRTVSKASLGLPEDRFVWTYAGNLGLSQNLGVAVRAAEMLGSEYQLFLLGDGASRPALEGQAARLPPGAVAFHDPVDPARAGLFMRASDALLVSLADRPALARTIPVKLYDCCAVGKPVLVAAPGGARRIAETTGAGLAVAPDDPVALADAVRRLRGDPALGERLVAAGMAFAAGESREAQIERLEAVLEAVAAG